MLRYILNFVITLVQVQKCFKLATRPKEMVSMYCFLVRKKGNNQKQNFTVKQDY